MGTGTEHELSRTRRAPGAGARPLVRRALWVAGTALAFVLLAVLGLGLASLLPFGDATRPEPEPAPVARPVPPRMAEPAPSPPRPATPPPAAPAPPPPAPAAAAATPQPPFIRAPELPLPARLRARREVLRDIGALKDELARCPTDPVTRSPPASRAALVLETVAEAGALRVVSSRLDAEGPVNDGFVSCARSVMEGKRFPVSDTSPGTRFQLFIPLGPNGNSLSLPSASLTEAEADAN